MASSSRLWRWIAASRLLRRRDDVIALAMALASLALYLTTISPSVVTGDGGEMQMLSQVLGVAHPTGYPLFLLLGWVFGHLPLGGDPAFRVTLLCAILTAVLIAFLYLLARELGTQRPTAIIAAGLIATATRFWTHTSAAEVYPLSSLFMVLGWWLLLRWGKGKAPLWAAALVFGFGLTHHISIRLLAPAALVYVLVVEPRLLLRPRCWLPGLACLLLPLLLYAYVPLRAAYFESRPELAGEILGVRKTVAAGLISPHYYAAGPVGLILALDYGRQLIRPGAGANPQGGFGSWPRAFAQFASMTAQQFPWLMLPFTLLGVGGLLRRQGKASLLLLLSLAATLAAALSFLARVGEDGDHFLPTYLLMALWFAIGADAALVWLAQRLRRWSWHRWIALAALASLPLANGIAHFPYMMQARQVDRSRDVLSQPLPQGAVITGEWPVITPLLYHQRVEGIRPDLWIIHTDAAGTGMLLRRALAQDTPFYTLRPTASGLRLLPLPLRDAQAITHPADVGLGPAVRWRGYDLAPANPTAGGELWITLYWQPIAPVDRDWTTFIHLLDERSEKVGQVDRVSVGDFYPPTAWQPGLLLADQYELRLRPDLPPGRYRLIFGWYSGGERLNWADGQDARLLAEVTIER